MATKFTPVPVRTNAGVVSLDYADFSGAGTETTAAHIVPTHVLLDASGNPITSSNPFPVAQAGSTGMDYSANQPALPNVGANFGSSGVYAGYVLIAAVPASPSRTNIDIENSSGAQIVVIRDDGTALSGAAPANASVFALGGGVGAGAQGGSWSSQTFKGRVQVYAASATAQVAIFAD
jgi:hypothetical protein